MKTASQVAKEAHSHARKRRSTKRTGDVELGRKLAALREKHGIRQEDVARELGFTRPHLANIENGISMPTLQGIIKFIVFYETSFEHLCGDMVKEAS